MKNLILLLTIFMGGVFNTFAQETECSHCCQDIPVTITGQVTSQTREANNLLLTGKVYITVRQLERGTIQKMQLPPLGDYSITVPACDLTLVQPYVLEGSITNGSASFDPPQFFKDLDGTVTYYHTYHTMHIIHYPPSELNFKVLKIAFLLL